MDALAEGTHDTFIMFLVFFTATRALVMYVIFRILFSFVPDSVFSDGGLAGSEVPTSKAR